MANQYTSGWNDEIRARMFELAKDLSLKEVTKKLNEEFNTNFTDLSVKAQHGRYKNSWKPQEKHTYKETTEILQDGTHKSDKLLRMNAEQSKDPNYLMKQHGYDSEEWTLTSAKNNIWNVYSKQDGVQTLYSSKITVKPKINNFTIQDLESLILKTSQRNIPKPKPRPLADTKYVNAPLFDMHLGISDYEYYKPTQERILGRLDRRLKDVLFIIGQDLFHNDDMRGRTASGREIDKVDMDKAWEDAFKFYEPLIETALSNSDNVNIYYSIGNHDESMAWAFVKMLERIYPQANVCTRFKERKVHMLGKNFCGMNHSDKKKEKKLAENFATEFPNEWSRATTREIYVGHKHAEMMLLVDENGIVIRRQPTGNRIDDYHDQHGYTTAHKRFKIYEYSEERVEREIYV